MQPTAFIVLCSHIVLGVAPCVVRTTPNLRELLKGRCLEFQTTVLPDSHCDDARNCSEIADTFMEAFIYQPTCNVNPDRFQLFLNLTNHSVPMDKAIFWEDVYEAVKKYTNKGKRLTSISDVLYGYLGDGLHFCAQPEEPGMIINKTCAGFTEVDECGNNAEYSFWVAASQLFSLSASGKVSIMLNASIENTFKEKTYFATYELSNFHYPQITEAEILLVRYPGHAIRSTCSDDSIELLTNILYKKGINVTCQFNPRSVLIVLCSDYPDHQECSLETETNNNSSSYVSVVNVLHVFSLTILLFFFGVFFE